MMRKIFPIFLTVMAISGCQTSTEDSSEAEVMVPGRSYLVTNSRDEPAERMIYAEDGRVMVLEGGTYVADGYRWFRRDGRLCTYRASSGLDAAFCATVSATENGGFDVIYEDAMETFRPVSG